MYVIIYFFLFALVMILPFGRQDEDFATLRDNPEYQKLIGD